MFQMLFKFQRAKNLPEKLCKTFADFVMFQNSGAEATEAAVKVARRYFYSIGKPKKNRILCVKNSFHGRTLAAIFASGSKKMTGDLVLKYQVLTILNLEIMIL